MSTWAYRCHSAEKGQPDWFVSQLDVEQLGSDVRIVRVRVGRDWKCAVLDRTQAVVVDDQLLRSVIASDETDCPECVERLNAELSGPSAMSRDSATSPAPDGNSAGRPLASQEPDARERATKVQAAAISLQGHRFVVVASSLTLVASPGEADMAIEDLQPYFGGAPVVLMAQEEDGSPRYYGDRQLVSLLAGIPLDKMPWKAYGW